MDHEAANAPDELDRGLTSLLPEALAALDRPGDYVGTGEAELPVVRLAVDGVGLLGLPIPPSQAEALRRVAEDAPYGRGPATLVDPTVRRCGQLEAAAVHADDPRWRGVLTGIVERAAAALGVDGKVDAELYKALVYEPGDFFVEHRDTEKSPGMFATLVVVLPSPHEGGELVVRHEGREATLHLSGDDLGVVRWAAFFCDCPHELRPLRSGYRVALVYNLVRRAGSPPRIPDASPVVSKLIAMLRAWPGEPDEPTKIVYPLAHRYTPAELGFDALKNEDAAAAQALLRAASASDCTVRLALLSIHEAGAAEPAWDSSYRSRRYDYDRAPTSYTVAEVTERSCTLGDWRAPDNRVEDLGAIDVDEEQEVAPPDALEAAEPDEDHVEEATGNAGASFERTYRWAALVVWPKAHELRVVGQGGADATLAALERFANEPGSPRVEAFAQVVIDDWARLRGHGERASERQARVLRVLSKLPQREPMLQFLRAIVAVGRVEERALDGLTAALTPLTNDEAAGLVETIVRRAEPAQFVGVARLLRRLAEAKRGAYLEAAVDALRTSIASWPAPSSWQSPPTSVRVRGLVELLCAAEAAGGARLATRVAEGIRALPTQCALDEVVIPALRALRAEPGRPSKAAMGPLLTPCLEHLRARCALPLAPPADAARATSGLHCTCADCQGLRAFLQDPVATTWQLRAAEARRAHVQHVVGAAQAEVSMRTDRAGRPYALVCTKTTARYDARVRQRAADQQALDELTAR